MYSMLLVTSRDAAKQASPASGKGPIVASVPAISAAAEVLKDSEELLRKLKKMLAEHKPVRLSHGQSARNCASQMMIIRASRHVHFSYVSYTRWAFMIWTAINPVLFTPQSHTIGQ